MGKGKFRKQLLAKTQNQESCVLRLRCKIILPQKHLKLDSVINVQAVENRAGNGKRCYKFPSLREHMVCLRWLCIIVNGVSS